MYGRVLESHLVELLVIRKASVLPYVKIVERGFGNHPMAMPQL